MKWPIFSGMRCAFYDGGMRAVTIMLMLASLLSGPVLAGIPNAPFGVDLQGREIKSLAASETRAVVLLFVATDCPISKRYLPEWESIARSFDGKGVAFYTVYPNPGETALGIRGQRAEFGARVTALRDPGRSLVRMAGAKVTPEAAVFVPDRDGLREVYRGRIDDKYLDLGHQRPQATRNELELAVKAVLAGAPVQPPGGRAVGCSIVPLP